MMDWEIAIKVAEYWQPIETFYDIEEIERRTFVLVHGTTDVDKKVQVCFEARYSKDTGKFYVDSLSDGVEITPTHWMPLPARPKGIKWGFENDEP